MVFAVARRAALQVGIGLVLGVRGLRIQPTEALRES
jgi:hypothetical protein